MRGTFFFFLYARLRNSSPNYYTELSCLGVKNPLTNNRLQCSLNIQTELQSELVNLSCSKFLNLEKTPKLSSNVRKQIDRIYPHNSLISALAKINENTRCAMMRPEIFSNFYSLMTFQYKLTILKMHRQSLQIM